MTIQPAGELSLSTSVFLNSTGDRVIVNLLVLILCVLPCAMADEQVFRWVDSDGVVHYSDRAQDPSATRLVLTTDSTIRATANLSIDNRASSSDNADVGDFEYQVLEFVYPSDGIAIRGQVGSVNARVRLVPELREQDELRYYYNGNRQTVESVEFQIDNVSSGQHVMIAEVVDESGSLMIRSTQIAFIVE